MIRLSSRQKSLFTVLFIGYGVYNLARKCFSFVFPSLIAEGVSKSDLGLIISSQNLAYAISKFGCGILSNKVSPRLLFSAGLFLSGLTVLAISITDKVNYYVLCMFINGIAQGCGWPAIITLINKWFLDTQFCTIWSILSASGNFTVAIGPIVSAYLTSNYGWRFTQFVFGSICVGWSFVTFSIIIDDPQEISHKVSDGSDKSAKNQTNDADSKKTSVRDLMKEKLLWMVSICYMVVYCVKTSCVEWGQLYVVNEIGFDRYIGSLFTSSFEVGGLIGGIVAGYFSDKMVSSFQNKCHVRMPVAMFCLFMSTVLLHFLCFYVNKMLPQVFLIIISALLGASAYGPVVVFGVVANELAPSHLTGFSHAIVALAACVGGIFSGIPFSLVASKYSLWSTFVILEILSGLTTVLMFLGRSLESKLV